MPTAQLPATKPYRVCIAGAVYTQSKEDTGPDGKPVVVVTRDLALQGQKVDLSEQEAHRLVKLGAVKPADEPLSYEEMNDSQLGDLAKQRGIEARGTGFDGAVTRDDLINANRIYDQAHGSASALPVPEAPLDAVALEAKIRDEKLSVGDTVALAGDDPVQAQAVLDAETAANDGSPRKGVEDKLQAVIDGA